MTELALPDRHTLEASSQPAAAGMLVAWARAAGAAHQLAVPLCETAFVPSHFQGKPGEATAAILYGAEAGLSPLQALQGVYVISGKPAMYARTLLAVTLGAGHEVWTEELTDSRAVVCGRRRGSKNTEKSIWTMDRAKKAGYTKNQKYTTDPQSMLLARAQSDVCRRIAPDALLGMPYSVEELEDESLPAGTVMRATGEKRTARRAVAPAPPEPDLESASTADEPAVEDGEAITPAQLKKLHAAMGDHGLGDRDTGLAYISNVLGRDVTTSKDLTKQEASKVIDLLESGVADGTFPEPPPEDESGWPSVPEIPA